MLQRRAPLFGRHLGAERGRLARAASAACARGEATRLGLAQRELLVFEDNSLHCLRQGQQMGAHSPTRAQIFWFTASQAHLACDGPAAEALYHRFRWIVNPLRVVRPVRGV